MRARLGMVAIIAVVGHAAAIHAATGTVTTKDGRTLRGEITEDGEQVRINRGGILIVLRRDEVKEIKTTASAAAEYNRRLRKLSRDDVAGHLRLAEWCRDQGLLSQATKRCEHVLDLDPDNTNAKLLLKALKSRARSKAKVSKKRAPAAGKTGRKGDRGNLLNKQQISRIRMAELRPGERVSVRFKNDVLNRFLDEVAGTEGYDQRGDRTEFLALSKSEQLAEIIELTGMYFADDIEIRSEPEALRVFKLDVMPTIRSSCAALKCHGGANAPKIRLQTQSTPAAWCTNYYTLDTYETRVPGHNVVKMFDRGYPEDGLFLNYLLPKHLAVPGLAHPGDIEPAVRDKDDRAYRMAADWIKEVLRRPRQDPGIEPEAKKKERKKPAGERDAGKPKRTGGKKE